MTAIFLRRLASFVVTWSRSHLWKSSNCPNSFTQDGRYSNKRKPTYIDFQERHEDADLIYFSVMSKIKSRHENKYMRLEIFKPQRAGISVMLNLPFFPFQSISFLPFFKTPDKKMNLALRMTDFQQESSKMS